jgi:hypothetical protein
MRKKPFVVIALAALCLQGCIVKSLHPFFKEKDVIYNKALEGSWTDQDKNVWRIHQNPYKPNSYELHCSKMGREVSLLGHLFTIDGDTYLDLMPLEDNSEGILAFDLHLMPTHSIAKVDKLTNTDFVIKWFNEEWLRKMFVENRIKIRHEFIADENPTSEDDGMYLLTASTDELQAFISKYGNDEKAYDDDLRLQLTR